MSDKCTEPNCIARDDSCEKMGDDFCFWRTENTSKIKTEDSEESFA